MLTNQEHHKGITFDEARRLYNEEHMRIRHAIMPEGVWIEPYLRPWGQFVMTICREDGSLSDTGINWDMLFDLILTEEDDLGWEAKTLQRGEQC